MNILPDSKTNNWKICLNCYKEWKSIYYKKYWQNNREKKNIIERKWRLNRIKRDPSFKIRKSIAIRIIKVLKKINKSKNTLKLLGCDLDTFKKYIKKQFYNRKDGTIMNFKNYGEWHLHHIKPCASFNLINEEEQRECFHYTNLQPLWKEDHIKIHKNN